MNQPLDSSGTLKQVPVNAELFQPRAHRQTLHHTTALHWADSCNITWTHLKRREGIVREREPAKVRQLIQTRESRETSITQSNACHLRGKSYTIICENFVVKNFHFARSDKNFLHKNTLPVLTNTANIWHALQVDENIVT